MFSGIAIKKKTFLCIFWPFRNKTFFCVLSYCVLQKNIFFVFFSYCVLEITHFFCVFCLLRFRNKAFFVFVVHCVLEKSLFLCFLSIAFYAYEFSIFFFKKYSNSILVLKIKKRLLFWFNFYKKIMSYERVINV
ncbi:hypothetical protein Hanom_Chr08g00754791 [Helianthus anomalus]